MSWTNEPRVRTPANASRVFAGVFGVGVIVNYIWELAQAPLFAGLTFGNVWWHCFIASMGDGLILLLILVIGWCVHRRLDWFVKPGVLGYIVMTVSGLLIATLIEWVAVHVAQRWSYAARMPLLPVLNIGLIPLAQMLVLPPLIFRIAASWITSRAYDPGC